MIKITHQGLFIFFTIIAIFLLYKLAPILTPFLLGGLLAYLTNPLVKRLTRLHIPHIISVFIVFTSFILIIFLLLLMLFPMVEKQIVNLIDLTPKVVTWVQNTILPWLKEPTNMTALKSTLTNSLSKAGWLVSTMLSSGYAIIGVTVNIVLTPIVFFYLLRDWDKLCNSLKGFLRKSHRTTLLTLAKECDEVLSAFFLGQFLVMLALMVIYGVGLTVVGLNVGLMIGIIGGLLSIVPYLGSTFVIVAATATAFVQFGTWDAIIGVAMVFLIGQSLESYVLTPYLVGNRIGLHPVAVIFSILAGGTLFGFFGVLIALPVTAVIKVLLRYVMRQYVTT